MFLDDSWFERAFDALKETFPRDKHLRKEMIQFLYDEGFWDPEKLSWEAAEKRFEGNTNPARSDTNWKLGEVWALMKRFGRHDFAIAMIDDLGYDVRRKATEERLQDLLERATNALERSESTNAGLRAELARITNGTTVEPRTRAGAPRPHFSRADECP